MSPTSHRRRHFRRSSVRLLVNYRARCAEQGVPVDWDYLRQLLIERRKGTGATMRDVETVLAAARFAAERER